MRNYRENWERIESEMICNDSESVNADSLGCYLQINLMTLNRK